MDDKLRTTAEGVYALGDVKGGPAFTHVSYDDYRVVKTNVLEGGDASIADRLVPYTVFMDPQLGRVGLSEKEARERGLDFRVAKLPMTRVARAVETDETRGFMKVARGCWRPTASWASRCSGWRAARCMGRAPGGDDVRDALHPPSGTASSPTRRSPSR